MLINWHFTMSDSCLLYPKYSHRLLIYSHKNKVAILFLKIATLFLNRKPYFFVVCVSFFAVPNKSTPTVS